jgi:hypothetical protein
LTDLQVLWRTVGVLWGARRVAAARPPAEAPVEMHAKLPVDRSAGGARR